MTQLTFLCLIFRCNLEDLAKLAFLEFSLSATFSHFLNFSYRAQVLL